MPRQGITNRNDAARLFYGQALRARFIMERKAAGKRRRNKPSSEED
jgi:hypothetical protein